LKPRDLDLLVWRARRSYEAGRLRAAAVWSLRVAPFVLLSAVVARGGVWTVVAGSVLFVVAVWLRWRGQHHARALVRGLVAGSVPLLVPLLMPGAGHCCVGGACVDVCVAACVGAGVAAGLLVGVWAATMEGPRRAFVVTAAGVTILVGSLGCILMSASGVLGMAAGVVLASTPFVLATTPAYR
jgi:hypothetical protein